MTTAAPTPWWLVRFDRISRDRNPPELWCAARDDDDLMEQVYRHARPRVLSRELDVAVDFGAGKGLLLVGGIRPAGQFTVTRLDPAVEWCVTMTDERTHLRIARPGYKTLCNQLEAGLLPAGWRGLPCLRCQRRRELLERDVFAGLAGP